MLEIIFDKGALSLMKSQYQPNFLSVTEHLIIKTKDQYKNIHMQVLNIFKNVKKLEFFIDSFDVSQEAKKIHLPYLESIKVWNYR